MNVISIYVSRRNKENKKVAINGAGLHTRYLMNLFDLSEYVTAIIDSDPSKQSKKYLRWTIYGEDELLNGEIDAVIVSSKAFESEIFKKIEKYSVNPGIEIVSCYGSEKNI